MKNLNLLLLGIFLWLPIASSAQTITYDQQYQLAKSAFEKADYASASKNFSDLLSLDPANDKSAYVSFYYGLSTYYLVDLEKSKNVFLGLAKTNKDWNKITEVQLWLCKIYFELDNPVQANYYAGFAESNKNLVGSIESLRESYYPNLDAITLESILVDNENDAHAAKYLAFKLVEAPFLQQQDSLLEELIIKYKLDSSELGLKPPADIFKDKYKVAVMLPLFTERLWHSGVYLQSSFAIELYEGMQLALAEMDTSLIELEVFDTKRDSSITQNILMSGQLKEIDAIIGPLYPDPIELVSAYSKENRVNFVNPVSTNSDLLANNPYAFLLRTGAESIGEIVSGYTRTHIDTGAFAVYYGPRKTDSLTAFNYSSKIEADSFLLAIRQRTSTAEARQIFDSLTSSIEVLDSVKLAKMYKDGEKVRFKPMMDSLLLKVDSLGHIFVASDNQAIASEVMAAIAYRGDTTQLIGVGNWYSLPNAGLDLMESLNVWLVMQEFENMLSIENLQLSERYRKKYSRKPSKYVFYGYHAMKYLGNSLLNYGVYFQNGYNSQGNLDPLYDFRRRQDNGQLVLYKLQEGRPIKVSKHSINP